MQCSYKEFFKAICLLFIIWTSTASSNIDSLNEDILLDSALFSIANIAHDPKNFTFSPHGFQNLFSALSLLLRQGKSEATEFSIWATLGVHPGLQNSFRNSLLQTRKSGNFISKVFILQHNSLGYEQKNILDGFLSTSYYDDLDNSMGYKKIASSINKDIGTETKGHIKKLINLKKYPDKSDYLVVNAAYYENIWGLPCNKTKKITFLNSDRKFVAKASAFEIMDVNDHKIRYMKEDGYQVFLLPLKADKHYMYIIYPDKDITPYSIFQKQELSKKIIKESKNIKSLYDEINKNKNDREKKNVALILPKFSTKQKNNLLKCVPYKHNGISPHHDVSPPIIQKSFIKVNRNYEAIKAVKNDADDFSSSSFSTETEKILINSPFAYMIVNLEHNDIIFVGTVYRPKYKK